MASGDVQWSPRVTRLLQEHSTSLATTQIASFIYSIELFLVDFQREMIDSRLVVLYVSTLYEKLKELDPIKVRIQSFYFFTEWGRGVLVKHVDSKRRNL